MRWNARLPGLIPSLRISAVFGLASSVGHGQSPSQQADGAVGVSDRASPYLCATLCARFPLERPESVIG